HLLVLDGTWNHVRGLYRANPWIAELPHVRLTPTAPSRYRIRREPHRHFLSTIEAVVAALRALEPGLEGLDALLDAFDRMVDAQLTWADGLERSPRTRAKERRSARCLPRALHEQFEELVVVYAEWSEPPAARQSGGRTPIQWSAVRPSTGESFERCVRPTDAHAEARFIELGLERSDASSESAAVEALVEFIGPGGVVASWDRAPLLHLEGALGDQQMLSLRDAYRALRGRTRGALETVLAREGATAAPLALGGRASERLGNAVALVSLLRALAAR
ncbi:MAG: DTW domain-containing protein, partial [Polyangiaceae bacterium]|nr:DTW domain-containing protein [Polyangiaceae bacterium]